MAPNTQPKHAAAPTQTLALALSTVFALGLTRTMRNAGAVANGSGIGDELLIRGTALGPATFIQVQLLPGSRPPSRFVACVFRSGG